ncbi:MAG: histidine triad nucleotide-binding protein [Minisyncoccia bacterium]
MKKEDCLFCKIVGKEIPAEIVFEREDLIIIKDIKPAAPIHHLIIPKKHIVSIAELMEDDKCIIGEMFYAAKEDATKSGLTGYKTVFNVGRDGGQVIDHLHLHLLGGWAKKAEMEKSIILD